MNICVVGAGYVGLVTGAVFADLGNEVVCVDNVAEKIDALQAGRLPIYEPGLEEMVTRNVGDGRPSFTTDLAPAVRKSVIVFIAVGPPPKADSQTDLSAVEAVPRDIARGMGLDARVNPAFLQAGLGYGGSCFPKDTDSLVHTAATLGYKFDLLRAVVDINAGRSAHFVSMIERALAPLPARRVAILGLAFKPNTDDMREAKSIDVITRLAELGATISAYDPVAMPNARKVLPTVVEYADSPYAAAAGADGVALITEWNEFKFLNLERLRTVMRRPVVFDGRNLWEAERMRRLGFEYYSIGRKPVRRS